MPKQKSPDHTWRVQEPTAAVIDLDIVSRCFQSGQMDVGWKSPGFLEVIKSD